MIAAATLIAFYRWWSPRLFPLAIACLGIACDYSGELLFIVVPALPGTPLYRTAALLTGGAANALYTMAGIILTMRTELPAFVKRWAWLAWLSGIALTIFTLLDLQPGVIAASAALIVFFTPLPVLVARWRA